MRDLTQLNHDLDARASTCKAIVGPARQRPSRSFAAASPTHASLSAWLPDGAGFGLALGYVPSTRAADGAPLDILVLGDDAPEPSVAKVRVIGALESDRTERGRTRRGDHVVAVAEGSHLFEAVHDIGELGADRLLTLTRAWSAYNDLRCASFQVVAMASAAHAVRLIDASSEATGPAQPSAQAVRAHR